MIEPDLLRIRKLWRQHGRSLVLCHGVFDVIHPGHINHFFQARAEGQVLLVAIVGDASVRKGISRPLFNQRQRSEVLQQFRELIDYVTIVDDPTAISLIEALHPEVYCKGPDYNNPNNPFQVDFQREKELVEEYGGRVVLTNGFQSSSTEIIQRTAELGKIEEIKYWLNTALQATVEVIGEPILDRYIYVRPLGRAPKDNLISYSEMGREDFQGGGWIVAAHVEAFARQVLYSSAHISPIVKQRYVDRAHFAKLFSVETNEEIDESVPIPGGHDILLVADYGHGMIRNSAVASLCQHPFIALTVQSNSANWGFNLLTKWPRASYVVVDQDELRLACSNQYEDIEVLAHREAERMGTKMFAVTKGHEGCLVINNGICIRSPAVADRVIDRMGAGDAFLAVTAPLVWAGAPAEIVALVGNIAGAIEIGKVGNQAITRREIDSWIAAHFLR